MNPMARMLVGVFLVAQLNCGAFADDKTDIGTDPELVRLRAEITALVGTATCANLVNCRVAALGMNACGGPAEYIAYSWRPIDQAALETKIAEYNVALEDAQERGYPVSACTEGPDPIADCVNGRCVIPSGR